MIGGMSTIKALGIPYDECKIDLWFRTGELVSGLEFYFLRLTAV